MMRPIPHDAAAGSLLSIARSYGATDWEMDAPALGRQMIRLYRDGAVTDWLDLRALENAVGDDYGLAVRRAIICALIAATAADTLPPALQSAIRALVQQRLAIAD